MTKSDTSLNDIFEPLMSVGTMFTTNPALGPQAQHFWEAQDRMLAETEKFSSAWFKRRHEATRSAMQASEAIAAEGMSDPSAALKAIADWHTHSMERLAQDGQDCMELMTRCADVAASKETEATEETVTTAEKSAKTSKSQPV